jgi:DNA-directed RNA polymerase
MKITRSQLKELIREEVRKIIKEGFTTSQQKKIADEVKRCYDEKGNNGVRDYDTLNKYLFNLPFEVDAADIKIEGWVSNSFNRQNKSAKIMLQGKQIGSLDS